MPFSLGWIVCSSRNLLRPYSTGCREQLFSPIGRISVRRAEHLMSLTSSACINADSKSAAEKPADPDGNGIICDSTKPVVPAQPAPEERAQAPDPCAELSFTKRYAGRPLAEAPNFEDPAIDPDGTGVACGHVLAKHGRIPFETKPETGKVLPRTGGTAVPHLVGLLLRFGTLGVAALRAVALGR